MAWFKLDDAMWSHPKFLGLSDRAHRLWVRAGAYCAQHLTDGLVTEETLRILGAQRRHCEELWAAGLWERVADGGYRFHDWIDYQPTRQEVLQARRAAAAERDRERERKARWREAKRLKREAGEQNDAGDEW